MGIDPGNSTVPHVGGRIPGRLTRLSRGNYHRRRPHHFAT
ncbi:MAG: hypothetical protein AVDCRST_MAG64-1042 [uncultured Phycisphaerae bacterium]|uniref:Uncharacterized protein n=1 Tax=uncultured Phycisphaerae bacterium TaxID=904963 RepID=A0A6J4NKG7_9BACT|nr:MAG: hypothetical protein AVDCRST_MAG64-1042 [uncultured Phycisphaerae bacterium]